MQITGAKKLIDDRGGYRAVADKLGWPLTTVHTFYRTDKAPPYRWEAIKALPTTATKEPPARPTRRARGPGFREAGRKAA